MISLQKAIETISANITPSGTERVPILESVDRVLAGHIVSSINVSRFRNSAMDGFAVRAELLAGCSSENPVTLPVAGVAYAGGEEVARNHADCALKIMTGAPVPDEYDSVVKVEDVTFTDGAVTFTAPVNHGANIRPAGEDVREGETVFAKGQRISALDIGVFASIGLAEVDVIRRPSIAVFTTGDELVEPGVAQLGFGQIYNSNRYTIAALIAPFCNHIEHNAPVADTATALKEALNSDSDVIITSGGVSAGDKDLVPQVAEELGWQELFHKIAIKPGKPVYFARRGNQLLFGLPGNPLSTAVSCATLVIPALKQMTGAPNATPLPQRAILRGPSRSGKRLLLWPGKIRREGATLYAEYSPQKSSAALTALRNTDGLIIEKARDESPDSDEAPMDGTPVDVLFWDDLLR